MKRLLPLFLLLSLVFSGCNNDDSHQLTLDNYNIELKSGDSKTVRVLSGETGINWRTENSFIATVDNGKVTAHRVGKTLLLANNTAAMVTVSPRYLLYDEPIVNTYWGMNKNDIFRLMGEKFPDKMESNLFTYYIDSPVNSFKTFEFDFSERLIAVSISVAKQKVTELDNFLAERYQEMPGGTEIERHYINGNTQTTSTMLISRTSYDDDYWIVSYRRVN